MGMSLSDEMQAVIANLEDREWIQDYDVDGDAVCAHGAVKTCDALRPGDEQIIRAVMRRRGLTEDWNDEDGRTKAEVLTLMRQIEVSDADLAETFGPNWRLVIAVIRRAAILTPGEVQQLAATRCVMRHAVLDTAWRSAWYALRDAARYAAWKAARDAAIDAVRGAMWDNLRDADARGAACAAAAAAVADLVGQHGLTQDHVDTLMKLWTDVLGDTWAEGMLP